MLYSFLLSSLVVVLLISACPRAAGHSTPL
jgi:hypothetical protein